MREFLAKAYFYVMGSIACILILAGCILLIPGIILICAAGLMVLPCVWIFPGKNVEFRSKAIKVWKYVDGKNHATTGEKETEANDG